MLRRGGRNVGGKRCGRERTNETERGRVKTTIKADTGAGTSRIQETRDGPIDRYREKGRGGEREKKPSKRIRKK